MDLPKPSVMGKIKKTLNDSKNLLDQNEGLWNVSCDLAILLLLYALENKNVCPHVSAATLLITPLFITAKGGKKQMPITPQPEKQMLYTIH